MSVQPGSPGAGAVVVEVRVTTKHPSSASVVSVVEPLNGWVPE